MPVYYKEDNSSAIICKTDSKSVLNQVMQINTTSHKMYQ